MSDTPNLDWLVTDFHCELWSAVFALDAAVPRGSPAAEHCGCCAGETVRMRRHRRRDRLPGRHSRMIRVCDGCDLAASDVAVPAEWA